VRLRGLAPAIVAREPSCMSKEPSPSKTTTGASHREGQAEAERGGTAHEARAADRKIVGAIRPPAGEVVMVRHADRVAAGRGDRAQHLFGLHAI